MVNLQDGNLRISTRIQKDYPNDQTPDPTTFELDQADLLETTEALDRYLDEHATLFPSQKGDR